MKETKIINFTSDLLHKWEKVTSKDKNVAEKKLIT